MMMEEDQAVLGITGTISEMKIADNEQSRNLEDESVNSCENEYRNTENETTNIQQLGNHDDVRLTV